MTHSISQLYWLSAGLSDILLWIILSHSLTMSALLEDSSATMFSRQVLDSAVAPLLSQALSTNSARIYWANNTMLSTSSARVCWANHTILSNNSVRVCWATATKTQRTVLSHSTTICTQQGDSVLGWLSLLHKLSKDLLSLPWNLCTTWWLSTGYWVWLTLHTAQRLSGKK